MLRIIAAAALGFVALLQNGPATPAAAPATQPTTRPADSGRTPEQLDLLRGLLNDREQPRPITPAPGSTVPQKGVPALDAEGRPLEREGQILVERPGRYFVEDGRPKFTFLVPGDESGRRVVELLPNQLLEIMERESESGQLDFTVSGELTRYRGRNYLLLRKILQPVANGNLSP